MRFAIAVDLEGVACVVGDRSGLGDGSNYDFAAKQGAREADAAARALFDMGTEQVIVWDNHGSGVNLDYDMIDSRCDIALGSGMPHRSRKVSGRSISDCIA